MATNSLRIYQVDAFTNKMFQGNPAAVVANADRLTSSQMQSIANELNSSETAFIFSPDNVDHEIRVRFFTPIVEVPSCGHASIAAAFIWAIENEYDAKLFRQKLNIGVFPLEVHTKENNRRVYMTQGAIEFGETLSSEITNRLLNSLQLTSNDLIENLPIQSVSTGHGKVIIPLKSRQSLEHISPNFSELIELSDLIGQNGFFPFAFNENGSEVLTHARMFAPKIGILEDPATGNGNGPLGAYLVHHNYLKSNGECIDFISKQGESLNRIGHIHVVVQLKNKRPVQVKVGGECKLVFKTTIDIDTN